jgi:hypothetical protein
VSEPPRYAHDCDRCTFLGRYGEADLYVCRQGILETWPTVVARFSDEGDDYASGLIGADYEPNLREARRRATERGLLKWPR